MDPLDVVRAYYRALNLRDADAVASAYDPSCVTECVFLDARDDVQRGREANHRELEAFLSAYEGGFEDGSAFRVQSIAGNETGWGWVRAAWIHRVRGRARGETRQFKGYSHFLIEDGLIRRQRTVAHEMAPADVASAPDGPSSRQYPRQPVVGIGGIVLVSPAEASRFGWTAPLAGTGVVLIKRQFEPLAGQWSLPGGALEVGETLEAGVAREVAEETGLTVDVGAIVEVFDRILVEAADLSDNRAADHADHHGSDPRIRYHFVLIDYVCRPLAGRLQAGSDVVDVTIADARRLEQYELTEKAREVIRKAIESHEAVER